MAKKNLTEEAPVEDAEEEKEERPSRSRKNLKKEVRNEVSQAIFAIAAFVVAVLAILASFGKAGFVGIYFYIIFKKLLGIGYFLLPIFCILLGISFVRGIKTKFKASRVVGSVIFFASALGIVDLFPSNDGGIIGHVISTPLLGLFEFYATTIILLAAIIVSLIVVFETSIDFTWLAFWRKIPFLNGNKGSKEELDAAEEKNIDQALKAAIGEPTEEDRRMGALEAAALAQAKREEEKRKADQARKSSKKDSLSFTKEEEDSFSSYTKLAHSAKPFVPPPLTLLEKDRGKPEVGDIKANANIIKRTLLNFGISVEMDEISIGPSVTRYALKPAEGVKLSKIVGLNNDLALALAAHPIRIEAPIPGKSLVGIEIPNTIKTTVGLATLLESEEYQRSEKPLLVTLGKDIAGKSYCANLAKAPHMLIAGATGSGKSVTIHALITSLLFRNSPENLKFIMIDPKRVELTLYNKIPHLLTPVITDAKKAILALKWAAKEMSRRYDILESHAVRDIESYHKTILAPVLKQIKDAGPEEEITAKIPENMPYIVIVLDELADIMQTYPRELESAIVRLAQMSRAVGIHLVLSTQRPSVNVITGLIKANVPTRVALQVSSQIDSRTILDTPGAEKLLGAGDMLYLGGEMSKPYRLQSAYISESELKRVVSYLADSYKDELVSQISLTPQEPGADAVFAAGIDNNDDLGEEDDMYEQARDVVVAAGKASTSYIQRKLGVGYSRAARLMDMLEERGVIGPANGSKPREVLGGGGSSDTPSDSDTSSDETKLE
ncbi:MAG: DNA translocase FtsK [Patescibacteria group bacterium]